MVDGIEYNQYPAPATLIKATEMEWAKKLYNNGSIRLNSVEYYQRLESPELGDRNEAKGMLKLDGHSMEVGSANEVFLWCSAHPAVPADVLKILNASYDAIVRVLDVEEFVARIYSEAKRGGYMLHPHIGAVKYNRGEEASKEALNNQQWQYNVFQKSSTYSHQREYRLSFTNVAAAPIGKNHIDLLLGSCRDIVEIET